LRHAIAPATEASEQRREMKQPFEHRQRRFAAVAPSAS